MTPPPGANAPRVTASCPSPGAARPSARIVLVNWKNAALTLRAAHSIAPQLAPGDRLVLVDNGSGDGSLSAMRAEAPGLRALAGGCGEWGDTEKDGQLEGAAIAECGQVEVLDAGENGGFGAQYGVPIGALIMEQYLNGKLSLASEEMADEFQHKRIDYGIHER